MAKIKIILCSLFFTSFFVACLLTADMRPLRPGELVCEKVDKATREAKVTFLNSESKEVTFRTKTACTAEEQSIGLSQSTGLKPDEGMLFEHASEGEHGLTMRYTTFPLDFIYLDSNWKVVKIARDLPARDPGYPTAICQWILAVRAGQAKADHIEVGNRASTYVEIDK
jgi:uncharacterized membrane protein (UPF0127 family)